jgi:hypothetical protein
MTNKLRPLAFLALLAAFLALPSSCGTLKTTPLDTVIPQATQDAVLNCAKGSAHDIAISLLDDVASALASGDWISLLKELGAKVGLDAVDCAVREVAGQSFHAAQVSGDGTQSLKAARGQQWLAARGRTTVEAQ